MSANFSLLIRSVTKIATDAGLIALEHRDGRSSVKSDGSPVTAADIACDEFITGALNSLGVAPVISEESYEGAPLTESFWLVDPLDGTKEFLKESGEFTVNIALIKDSRPVLGVVHVPVLRETFYAALGHGAFKLTGDDLTPIHVSPARRPLRMAVSRDHLTAEEQLLAARLGDTTMTPMGSSLKFCRVAEGAADLYVRYGRTREWDTAAAQCVLECAGGLVIDLERNEPLLYAKPELLNPSFLAYGDAIVAQRVLGDC